MSIYPRLLPTSGLLFGAIVWGIIWYPYRLLETAGISGVQSTLITYGVATLFGLAVFAAHWQSLKHVSRDVLWIALAAGWTNLSYVLAMLGAEVMRVLLLFYLAPLWTLLLARLMLDEHAGRRGVAVMGLSLVGAALMLWQGGNTLPVPQNGAEWLGLSAGMGFALTNVLTRRAGHLTLRAKSMAVWMGVCLIAPLFALFDPHPFLPLVAIEVRDWIRIGVIGFLLAVTTLAVQFGLTHTPANRAAVIFMFELVVGALSSWWLAGEVLNLREWLGGAMIIAAALMPDGSGALPPGTAQTEAAALQER